MADYLKLKKSNCKNCYKCIRHCPVKSIRFSGNQAHIVGNECVLCGQCFVVCPQNAKQILDSTEQVKVMIASGDPVIASIAPSFVANYGVGIDDMRIALKNIGFADVEETAIGATIVKREYQRILREEHKNILISSCCHSVNLLIQKHFPSCLPYLADVVSPMLAHCQDIKRRYPSAKTVFIGPCVAKKDEADYYAGITDAVMTFDELTCWINEEKAIPQNSIKPLDNSLARFFPTAGGILKTMADEMLSDYTYISIDGMENCMAALRDIEEGKLQNCFIEMSACVGSCIGGPVMEKHRNSPLSNYKSVSDYAGEKDFDVEQPNIATLHKNFEVINHKLSIPSDSEIFEVLKRMGKHKPEDELNCGSCGYNTCREKAIAIIQGKAEVSMCLPFLKERAENFSNNIINNSPNALVVLNEDCEVQQINRAALKLMNLKRASDVIGEPVVRILDPKPFLEAKRTARTSRADRIYLAEYDKYVEQTVVFDREYKSIICILRDVTDEELQRSKKEEISLQTVDIADKVVEKQMRIVQEIASLLGETAAETKIALTKLKESIKDE